MGTVCPRSRWLLPFPWCSSWLFLLLYRVPCRHPFAPYPTPALSCRPGRAPAIMAVRHRSGRLGGLPPPKAGPGQGLWPWWNRPTHRAFLFSCGPPPAGRTKRRDGKGVSGTPHSPRPKGPGLHRRRLHRLRPRPMNRPDHVTRARGAPRQSYRPVHRPTFLHVLPLDAHGIRDYCIAKTGKAYGQVARTS